MKRFISIIAIVSLVVMTVGFSALAAAKDVRNRQARQNMDQPMGQQGGPQDRLPDAAPDMQGPGFNWKDLDLSDEQRDQIREKTREFQLNTVELRKKLDFAQQDLRKAVAEDAIDQAKVDSLLKEIATVKGQLEDARLQNMLAIKSILTPEQVEKLAAQQAERKAKGPLSEEQRKQIEEITKASAETMRTLRDELRDLRDEFQELLMAKDTDQAKLQQIQGQIAEKEAALEKAQVDRLLSIKKILTPEQFKQFQQMQAQRKQAQQRDDEDFQGRQPQNQRDRLPERRQQPQR